MATSTPGSNLLPAGYLSTHGNQIVDQAGNSVRLCSVGWNGLNVVGGVPDSTYGPFSGIQANVNAMKADGFNTIRVSWTDATLNNPTEVSYWKQIVQAATNDGMKVIFDHHNDEGSSAGDWVDAAQQGNGLWFDEGPGTNGTDGYVTGHVTAAQFQADWVKFASMWAGNATVIGFDLDNEPTMGGSQEFGTPITWGGGGVTDIHAMFQNVGDAIQKVDPGALIICEGPQNYVGDFAGTGPAPEGDLSMVGKDPVVLTDPNKVVYSVHEYPNEISGIGQDSGAAAIQRMNNAWGYLERQNIAPVWIGEMGASMDDADATAWASTLLAYMNGKDAAQGGPSFTGGQQPVSGSWWSWGYLPGEAPDGFLQANGSPQPAQLAEVKLMMPVASTGTGGGSKPSPNDTVVKAGSGGTITDASGNVWAINGSGQITVNGAADATTASVIELAYVNGSIWQENTSHLWWGKSSPGAAWGPNNGTATSPLPSTITPSPNDTVVTLASGGTITDAKGDTWTIRNGQVAVNGVVDPTTANVIELAFVNSVVWQENSQDLWWGKATPSAAWSPNNGTSQSPLPSTPSAVDSALASSGPSLHDFVVSMDAALRSGTIGGSSPTLTGSTGAISQAQNAPEPVASLLTSPHTAQLH